MKLAVSNIAWDKVYDESMYACLKNLGYQGIEIAPTRIWQEKPYDKLLEAKEFADKIHKQYSLNICSMQSIWFGRQEGIFRNASERHKLINYTKRAIDFACLLRCPNLVFGSPQNRMLLDKGQYPIAVDFFAELGEYAAQRNAKIAIEANPVIYHTNFINTTEEAFKLCKDINSKGVMVNLDCGTIIENGEQLSVMINNIAFISHVHISEPYLEKLEKRLLHAELYQVLREADYQGYVSIEMKKCGDLEPIKTAMAYVKEIFS